MKAGGQLISSPSDRAVAVEEVPSILTVSANNPVLGVTVPSLRGRDVAAVMLSVTFWGISFPLLKRGLDFAPPIALGASRNLIAAAIGFSFLGLTGRFRGLGGRLRNGWPNVVGVSCFLVLVPNTAQNIGLQFTTASLAALIQVSAPAFTVMLAPWLLGERLSARKLVGLSVALAASGGLVLVGQGSDSAGGTVLGNVLMVVTALSYGFAPLFSKKALRSLEPLETLVLAMGAGAVVLFAVSLMSGESATWPVAVQAEGWVVILLLGLLPCFLAQFFWYTVLRHQEASKVILFTYIIPLVGLAVSAVWLGERPRLVSLVMGVFILAGVAIVQSGGKKVTGSELRVPS